MTDREDRLSKAQLLASLVSGLQNQTGVQASIQRSHRFPLHLFCQIENLAKMGDVSVSVIINELLECGLEALMQELDGEAVQQVIRVSPEQMQRPTTSERIEIKGRNLNKPKITRAK